MKKHALVVLLGLAAVTVGDIKAFQEAKLEALDKTIEAAIADGRIPGAVFADRGAWARA